MKVVFVSNYFNHHQKFMSDALFKLTEGNYTFVATEPMPQERIKLGYSIALPEYVKDLFHEPSLKKECLQLINEADVVIAGSAPNQLLAKRLKNNKLTFRYSERIFRSDKIKRREVLLRKIVYSLRNKRCKRLYMLCASAYAASDYKITKHYINRTYKWGYFPEAKQYGDIEKLLNAKKENSILWVARFIPLKHAEHALITAKRLKENGYDIQLNLIGTGPMEERIQSFIAENGMADYVHMLGAMPHEQVRSHMEEAEIFWFTSDRNEGWGAVLNEAMNSGCAVVASHEIGSVPFLLKNGVNGCIYEDGNLEDLYQKTKFLLDDSAKLKEICLNSYNTIHDVWNAECAAQRVIALAKELQDAPTGTVSHLFQDGPCSFANDLNDNWIKKEKA